MPYVHQIEFGVRPEVMDLWTAHAHNNLSVMARHTGLTSYEIMQDLNDPEVFLVLRNYEDVAFSHIMRGGHTPYQPTKEVQYVTKVTGDFGLYKGSRAVEYTDCDIFDGVIG